MSGPECGRRVVLCADEVARDAQGWRETPPRLPDGALVACPPGLGFDPTDPIGAFRDAAIRWLASDAIPTASLTAGLRWVPGQRRHTAVPASARYG